MTAILDRPLAPVLLCTAAAALVGYLIPLERRMLVYGVGAALTLGAVVIVWTRTDLLLVLAPLMVFLAQTSYRGRDPTLLLRGVLDAQVLYQMGLYALVALAALAALRYRARVHLSVLGRNPFAAAYVGLAVLSVGWAVSPIVTLARAFQLVTLYGLCWAAMRRIGQERFLRSIGASAVAYVLIGSFLAFLFPWARGAAVPGDIARFSWFSVHPGLAATYAVIGALLVLAEIVFGGRPEQPVSGRAWRWGLFAYLVFIMLKTWARATVFGFVAAAVAMLLVRLVRGRLALTAALLAVVAGGLLGLPAASAAISDWLVDALGSRQGSSWLVEFIARGEPLERVLSLTGRRGLWDYALTLIQARPLGGYGYAGSRTILLGAPGWGAGESHNAVIEVLVGLGAVGFALLLLAFVSVFAAVFGAVTKPRGQTPIHAWSLGALVFLFMNSFVSDSFAGVLGINVLVFLAVSVAYGSSWPRPEAAGPRADRRAGFFTAGGGSHA